MSDQQYKYFAFISYNSKDTEWGKRVQRKLEHYRMPATMCTERGWKRTPLRPFFFAPTDIQPGGLSDELKERLEASRNLIVICSPNSAKSEWVGREIEYFHNLGRSVLYKTFVAQFRHHTAQEALLVLKVSLQFLEFFFHVDELIHRNGELRRADDEFGGVTAIGYC